MADHTFTGSIDAPADEVWKVVRDFGNGEWMGVDLDVEGEGVGAHRTLAIGGTSITEACERLDDDARVLGYSITDSSGMPFDDYHATITVNGDGSGAEVVWSATYEPNDPAAATATLDAIYSGGFAALKAHCER